MVNLIYEFRFNLYKYFNLDENKNNKAENIVETKITQVSENINTNSKLKLDGLNPIKTDNNVTVINF